MIGPCAIHIPVGNHLPAHVTVIRGGHRLRPPAPKSRGRGGPGTPTTPGRTLYIERADVIHVDKPAAFTFDYQGNRFQLHHAVVRLSCRHGLLLDPNRRHARATLLTVDLDAGLIDVRVRGVLPRHAVVYSPELVALATARRTRFAVERNPATHRTRAWTRNEPIAVAESAHQKTRTLSQITYTAISDAQGLRLDIWPFAISRAERAPTGADGLTAYWLDGQQCSLGCTPPGINRGWPIKPFHQQHAIRASLNELRPANFHIGIDIEARNYQYVYPIESGTVSVSDVGTPDEHVQVGQFQYWHIYHMVSDGQYAVAYQTRLGNVKYGFKHVHLSEIGPSGQYLNPLRPGLSLSPYRDTEPPVIGTPQVFSDGRVIVGAFDPQSDVEKFSYKTPVLAPAALAWRLFDASGHALTGLEWALRGSQNYPPSLKPVIFAPGAMNPGFDCFAFHVYCIPNWVYWLAGGLTGPVPLGGLARGRYRLAVYAWDWAGNAAALDHWISVPLAHADRAPLGPLNAQYEP